MKKAGGSFRPAAVGGFLTAHVEKVAFGCLLALALALTWWGVDAVRTQRVDQTRTAAAISALAGQAGDNVRRAARIPAGRIPEPRSLSPLIDPWRPGTVELADPPVAAAVLSRPLFAELTKRTKPTVFPIEELRAVAGIAVLPDPDAGLRAPGIAPRGPDAAAPPESDPRRRPGRRPRGRDREAPEAGGLLGPYDPGLAPEAGGLGSANPQPPGRVTPFVVVTGLIPASRQKAEFEQRFSATSFQDARRDRPRWGVYIVERARVVPGGSLTWERQEVRGVERAQQPGGRIAGSARPAEAGGVETAPLEPETLPEAFFLLPEEADIGYVAPLPQRLDEPWGAVAVHPWFVPRLEEFRDARKTGAGEREGEAVDAVRLADLLEDPRSRAGDELRLDDVVIEASPERQKDVGLYKIGLRSADGKAAVEVGTIGRSTDLVFAISEAWGERLTVDGTTDEPRASNVRIRVDQVGRTPVARILEIELLDADGKAARTLEDPEPRPVGQAGGFGPMDGPAAPGSGLPLAENRLFRFFDATVKSGETYRYRVKFALRNPNAGLSAKHLADPASAKGDFLISEFSVETPPVRVPDTTVFLARTIDRETARKLKMREGLREVMVLAPSEKTGNLALRSTITDVGGLVNVDVELNRPGDVRFFGEPVVTDRVLVDARGRQEDRDSRSAEPPEPVEMLFLRPDGGFEFTAAADSERSIRRYGDTLFRPGTRLPDDGRSSRDERDGDPLDPRGTR